MVCLVHYSKVYPSKASVLSLIKLRSRSAQNLKFGARLPDAMDWKLNMRPDNTFPAVDMIEKTFLKVISDLAEREIASTATLNSLKEVGIDSLGVFQVICEVEQHLKISIPNAALQDDEVTIAQLAVRIYELEISNELEVLATQR